jgi:hypothetical protein
VAFENQFIARKRCKKDAVLVQGTDLHYNNLLKVLAPLLTKGRSESATFLNWFLENLYRLESSVAADDCICDATNDKGVDGIYVDVNNEEIHFFQSKIRQKDNGTIGDVSLKTFSASVQQFSSPEKIDVILNGDAGADLKALLVRLEIKDLLAKGYRPIGVYVTNESRDAASDAYTSINETIRVYDREVIAANYVEANQVDGVQGEFTFDVSYVDPLEMTIGGDQGSPSSSVFIFPALASQLVELGGIADTTLFTKNVRYDLGNTAVNKSIKSSIEDKAEHKNFSLFHNGIIILCERAKHEGNELAISNYSVVNGAQSLTTFFKSKTKLTTDLRVLVRVIALQNDALARKITEYSNNQNAIKPRDLRSNHALMTRLQNEINTQTADYFFEIKRGEVAPEGRKIISNDMAGRALLAFDLLEPWSSHQIYKVFDEKYSEIFGRIEVGCKRILFVMDIDGLVSEALDGVENKPLAHYALTKYFMMFVLAKILRGTSKSAAILRDPSILDKTGRREEFLKRCSDIMSSLVVDLNYEVEALGQSFDYKAVLKSPKQSEELSNTLIKSYKKDVARDKAASFDEW